MGRRKPASRRTTEEDDGGSEAPLFDDDGRIDHIAVERLEPPEGYLGTIDPSSTEDDIRAKYGGGKFRLRARDAGSHYVKGIPVGTHTIGGDPVFQSVTFEQQWRRRQGLTPAASNSNGVISEKPLGFGELMLLMDKQSERARAMFQEQAQIREREAAAAHERQLEQIKAEAKRRESELAFERERLKTEAQEREGRLGREAQAERDRQREHNAAMLQIITEKGKQTAEGGAGVQTLIAGIKLAQELGGGAGGEGGDPLTAFANNLPEIIEQGGKLIALDKATGGQAGKVKATTRAQKVGKDDVVLQGEVARKAAAVVKRLEQQGKDPARVLARAFDVIGSTRAAPASRPPARAARPAARAAARKPPPRRAPTPAAPKSPAPKKPASR